MTRLTFRLAVVSFTLAYCNAIGTEVGVEKAGVVRKEQHAVAPDQTKETASGHDVAHAYAHFMDAQGSSSAASSSAGDLELNSWHAVWILIAMIICAISPILFKEGPLPFMTVVLYLACLSLVKMYVKETMSTGFEYPDTITMAHMLGTALFAGIIERPRLHEAWLVFPISAVNGISLILNNTALVHGGVAFISMISCCTPIFTFLLQLSKSSRSDFRDTKLTSLLPVLFVCAGAMFCVKGERIASMASFIFAVLATFFRATKSVWQHELLSVSMSPLRLVFWSGFWSFWLMIPITTFSEGASGFHAFPSTTIATKVSFLLSVLCACLLNVTQCYAVKQLGAVMQSIVGNLNLILVIVLSQAWLHEEIAKSQYIGVTLLVSGTVLSKICEKKKKTKSNNNMEENLVQSKDTTASAPGTPGDRKNYGNAEYTNTK